MWLVIQFQIPAYLKVLLIVAVGTSLIISMHKTGWSRVLPKSWGRLLRWQYYPKLIWQSDNTWQLSTKEGLEVNACLLPTTTCHFSFVALNFRAEQVPLWNRYISVVIFADAIDGEVFRQLRARLRTRFVREQDNSEDKE